MTESPTDPSRRQFFRRFAGEVLTGAAQVVAVVDDLRERSAAEAAGLLADGSPVAAIGPGSGLAPTGFRTPFRFESDDVLLVIDQRRLPDALLEIPVRGAHDTAAAIRDMAIRGAPAIGQVAALGLALQARSARTAHPVARRAILEGAADTLRAARPTAINLAWAVDRVLARFYDIGELSEDGDAIATAMLAEATAIVAEATDDHGRMAAAGLELLPTPDGRPVQVLTHCNTGPLGAGQYGTALGVVQAAHHADRPIHVWVDETRPYLQGARLTAWELDQAGVSHTLIADVAAGSLIARGDVDAILVGADRIAANGDTANKVGTYPLAVLAERHGVAFYVVAPLSSVDLATADGAGIPIEERRADEVTMVRGVRVAPPATMVWNPAFDITPAALITAIVTEEGVLRASFGPALADAVARREARRSRGDT
ncbi:MAG TPA: S-methyl-5-thioribose-1-phosphate isomerase [Candidatus Limnocylindrales bacterium]|nr:S-methyl-5-thioribose-1-phosphate isomerase [Candidatus Limnocylindrales bacterium]